MRDYTTNNFCDYLWIGDLLELKQNDSREFHLEITNNRKPTKVKIGNVIIFGTIVEVKQVGCSGYLYHVDDGTGVIACKHSEDQFQELIRSIEDEQVDIRSVEDEQVDVSNQTFEYSLTDISTNDTVFNDRSIQLEEINFNKKSRLMGLQSIWNDIYDSFHCLIEPYTVGDTVIIQGKLYSYIKVNQIYVNNIRPMGFAEEIIQISIKLEDGLDKSNEKDASKTQKNPVNRMSGLMTFDNIPHLDPKFTNPRNIQAPELRTEVLNSIPAVVTPNLKTELTFDTFTSEGQNPKFTWPFPELPENPWTVFDVSVREHKCLYGSLHMLVRTTRATCDIFFCLSAAFGGDPYYFSWQGMSKFRIKEDWELAVSVSNLILPRLESFKGKSVESSIRERTIFWRNELCKSRLFFIRNGQRLY